MKLSGDRDRRCVGCDRAGEDGGRGIPKKQP